MKTFILLSFGFLGFAFYELSGGADFEPASARMASLKSSTAKTTSETSQGTATNAVAQAGNSSNVTRVALDLTNVSNAAAHATVVPAVVTSQAKIIDSAQTEQIILPSLIATTQSSTTPDTIGDIRTVSGNRVNVRGGPSTSHGVVNKLTRGASVEILEDNGDGWVLMQPVDGGESGWIADFLLTSG